MKTKNQLYPMASHPISRHYVTERRGVGAAAVFLLVLAFLLLGAWLANAQQAEPAPTSVATSNPPSSDSGAARWISFEQNAAAAGNVTVAASPAYAPGLMVNGVKKEWGFNITGLYEISPHTFTGLRLDYIGDAFFNPSADVGAKYDFQIKGHDATVFGITGISAPLQGAGDQNFTPGAILGAGIYSTVWQPSPKTALTVFFEAERWTQFSHPIYHAGPAFTATW